MRVEALAGALAGAGRELQRELLLRRRSSLCSEGYERGSVTSRPIIFNIGRVGKIGSSRFGDGVVVVVDVHAQVSVGHRRSRYIAGLPPS
eukprot:5299308-Pleurochrysis_carterae.AAC.1